MMRPIASARIVATVSVLLAAGGVDAGINGVAGGRRKSLCVSALRTAISGGCAAEIAFDDADAD